MSSKRELRARWKMQRPTDPSVVRVWSESLCAHLLRSPIFHRARQVAIFSPHPWEPDLGALWKARPVHCFFPRVDPQTLAMTFFRVDRLTELSPGFGRIPEPPARRGYEAAPWAKADLVLVPGTAFDRFGGRVGSGLGCYDRFLSGNPATPWGVAFSLQVVTERLAQDPTDVRMQALCTELEIVSEAQVP